MRTGLSSYNTSRTRPPTGWDEASITFRGFAPVQFRTRDYGRIIAIQDELGQWKVTFVQDQAVRSFTAGLVRRGSKTWVLDDTDHNGGEVLRFFSTKQLLADLSRGELLNHWP